MTDAVAIFNLYRVALPGQLIPIKINVDGNALSMVDVMCLANETTNWIFVVNRSLDETAQVRFDTPKHDGAVCEGFADLTPTGTFRHIEPCQIDDCIEAPPLSILRITVSTA